VMRLIRLRTPSDATIRTKLLEELKKQFWAHPHKLNSTVANGVVDLWGFAESETERRAITVAAETAPGVVAVNDHLMGESSFVYYRPRTLARRLTRARATSIPTLVFENRREMKATTASIEKRIRRRPQGGGSTAPSLPDCQAAFQRIARNCLHLMQSSRRAAIAADPDAIHAMRMELTRLRAAVLFFSPMVKDTAWASIRHELRWLNAALGEARDHDVTTAYFRRKRYRAWAKSSRHRVLQARKTAHLALGDVLRSTRYERLMATLRHWISKGPWLLNDLAFRSEHVEVHSRALLRDWRKRISQKGRHLRTLRRTHLHRLRIQCKRYRYILASLQTLGVAIGKQDLAFADTARKVHQTLGDLRDLKRLRKTSRSRPPGYRKDKRKLLHQAQEALLRRG
jgi:CHAD domain-containing protein